MEKHARWSRLWSTAPTTRAQLRLLGVPIHVELGFVLLSMLFGVKRGAAGAVVSMIVIFVSLLAHEMAHALLIRHHAGRPTIHLRAYGGTTTGAAAGLGRGARALIALAGPLVSLAIGTAAYALGRRWSDESLTRGAANTVAWVNTGWAAMSLIPTRGFDGGELLACIFGSTRRLEAACASLGIVLSAGAFFAVRLSSAWGLVACCLLLVSVGRDFADALADRHDRRWNLEGQLEDAAHALRREQPQRTARIVQDVLCHAQTTEVVVRAHRLATWAAIAIRDGQSARRHLAALPRTELTPYLIAAVEDAADEPLNARLLLEFARLSGDRDPSSIKLLIDLYVREGRIDDALRLAASESSQLSIADLRCVLESAPDGTVTAATLQIREQINVREAR